MKEFCDIKLCSVKFNVTENNEIKGVVDGVDFMECPDYLETDRLISKVMSQGSSNTFK